MGAVSFGKRVGEGTSQAVERIAQVDAAKKLDAKLRDVGRALDKLDDGTYGTCDVCGAPVGRERLEAIPGPFAASITLPGLGEPADRQPTAITLLVRALSSAASMISSTAMAPSGSTGGGSPSRRDATTRR